MSDSRKSRATSSAPPGRAKPDLLSDFDYPDAFEILDLGDPPPGLTVRWEPERLEVVRAPELLSKLVLGLGWLVASALLWLDRLAPRLLALQLTGDFPWPLVAGGWLVFTALVWLALRWRTEIVITRRELTVVHRPGCLGRARRVPLAQLRDIEIATRCTRRPRRRGTFDLGLGTGDEDEDAEEHYTFTVLAARCDSPDHPVLLRTTSEGSAVYLRRLLHGYLETIRPAGQP